MEATGAYRVPLAEFLSECGYRVSVVKSTKIHAFAKTDRADAKLIAHYCLTMRPSPWTTPPKAVRNLQALLHRAELLLKM